MTAPSIKLTLTQRERFKLLTFEESQTVTPGRVMLRKGRRIVGYCNLDELVNTRSIEAKANTVCLSSADYADVMRWLA